MSGQEDKGGIRPEDIGEGLDLSAATEESSRPAERTSSPASDKLGSVAPSMAANLTHGQRIRVEDLHNRTLGNRQKSQPEAEPKGERYTQQLEEKRLRQVEEATKPGQSEAEVKKRTLLNGVVRQSSRKTRTNRDISESADKYAKTLEARSAHKELEGNEETRRIRDRSIELGVELEALRAEIEELGNRRFEAAETYRDEARLANTAWDRALSKARYAGRENDPEYRYWSSGDALDNDAYELASKFPGLTRDEAKAILARQSRKAASYLFPDQYRERDLAEGDLDLAEKKLSEARARQDSIKEEHDANEAKKAVVDQEMDRLRRDGSLVREHEYRRDQEIHDVYVDHRRQEIEKAKEFAESLYDLNPELFGDMDVEEFLAKVDEYGELLNKEDIFSQFVDGINRKQEFRDNLSTGLPVELLKESRRGIFSLGDPSTWTGGDRITTTIGAGTVTIVNPNFVRGLLGPEDIEFIEEQTAKAEQALNSIDITPREASKIVKEASDKASERFISAAEESMRREREKLIGRSPEEPQPVAA